MPDHSPGFLAATDRARALVEEIPIAAYLDERRTHPDDVVLVDVREDREWARDRLPGAVHLGRGVLERDVESRFPDRDARLILYCGGGYRSALAAHALQEMGYRRVASLVGGRRAWIAAGHPLDETPQDPAAG